MLGGFAKAPFARGVGGQGLVQRGFVKVRPEPVAEEKLAVGALPEQEVADALLAAGANQEIGIGLVRQGQSGDRKSNV